SPCATAPPTRNGWPSVPGNGVWTPSPSPTATPSPGASASPRPAPGRASAPCSAPSWRWLPLRPPPVIRRPAAAGGARRAAANGARGWADLCRLVSAAHATGPGVPSERGGPPSGGLPLLPWEDNHADGLTVLLGPDSDVGRALAAGRPDRAARLLAPWREVYG